MSGSDGVGPACCRLNNGSGRMSGASDWRAKAAGEDEVVSSRVFDAPREAVFRAFAEPGILARWWGPKGFANTFREFDLRPGGAWRFVMHGPDGRDYEMVKEFVEVVAGERVVLRHVGPMH